jgi:amyloid beta precursor protein binding protein 1
MIGTLRVYKQELCVIEAKPSEIQIDDLRIPNPFPALKDYALSIKLEELDSMVHAHFPFNLLLI